MLEASSFRVYLVTDAQTRSSKIFEVKTCFPCPCLCRCTTSSCEEMLKLGMLSEIWMSEASLLVDKEVQHGLTVDGKLFAHLVFDPFLWEPGWCRLVLSNRLRFAIAV